MRDRRSKELPNASGTIIYSPFISRSGTDREIDTAEFWEDPSFLQLRPPPS